MSMGFGGYRGASSRPRSGLPPWERSQPFFQRAGLFGAPSGAKDLGESHERWRVIRPKFKRPAKLRFCRVRISGIPEQGHPERHRLGSFLRGGKGLELLLPFRGSSALDQMAAQ